MKTSIIVAGILALSVGQARAECFARSASVSDMPLKRSEEHTSELQSH